MPTSKLPVVYLVEDNGYAISVPVEVQHGGRHDLEARALLPGPVRGGGGRLRPRSRVYAAMKRAVRLRAQAQGAGARPRPRDPSLLALAVRRRGALPPAEEREADASAIRSRTFPRWLVAEGFATEDEILAHPGRGGREVLARDGRRARAAAARARRRSTTTSTRPTSIPTSAAFDTEDAPQLGGHADDDGRPAQRVHEGRDAARSDASLVFGEDVADASREDSPAASEGQGRRLQGHVGPAEGVRRRARLQLAARRGEHRRPRDRAGAARLQAGRRDPVLRLHLAGVHADPRRARDDALALEQRLRRAGRHPRDVRRLHPAARSTTRSPARRCSRTSRACASSAPRPRSTRTGCCARRSAATTR